MAGGCALSTGQGRSLGCAEDQIPNPHFLPFRAAQVDANLPHMALSAGPPPLILRLYRRLPCPRAFVLVDNPARLYRFYVEVSNWLAAIRRTWGTSPPDPTGYFWPDEGRTLGKSERYAGVSSALRA